MKVARNFLPGKEQLGGKSKASGTSPRMLQGELLLENIKVVRNDLSDADWEIVARKVTKQAIAPVAQTVPAQIMAANPAVSRTSSRLCGLGKP
jgi:hypothetical protein